MMKDHDCEWHYYGEAFMSNPPQRIHICIRCGRYMKRLGTGEWVMLGENRPYIQEPSWLPRTKPAHVLNEDYNK